MPRSTQLSTRAAGGVARGRARPRYRQLADQLIDEIRRGRRPVGSTLPGEIELMAEFSVSRHTVREALRRLEELGLIERRRRHGTRVRARMPIESYVHIVRSPGDLLQYPADSRLEPLDRAIVRLDPQRAGELGCAPRSRWFRLSALRRLPGSDVPVCRVEVYLLPAYAGVAKDVGHSSRRVFEWVERRFGRRVAHVRVDISAHGMPEESARVLGVMPDTPSLRVVRRYYDDAGELFEVTSSEHPADRFAYSLELTREWLQPSRAVKLSGTPR